MKILFIGDIVGRPGRKAVKELSPGLKTEYDIDLVVANGENLAAGRGFTPEKIAEMQAASVDLFTSGNHVWANQLGADALNDKKLPMIRPANVSANAPGRGYLIHTVRTKRILLINLAGEVGIPYITNPLIEADNILSAEAGKFDFAIVDIHAEYTSEKAIIGWHLDGRVNAVIGTHTHIPTADAKILPKGTAFITDVGMCGQKWGSLGIDFEPLINQYLNNLPARHNISGQGPNIFSAVLLNLGSKNSIELIQREIA